MSTTLISKHGETQEKTNYDSLEAGLVALILDSDGSFLTVNNPQSLEPLLYQKKGGNINIINMYDAPSELNLSLLTNPEIQESVRCKPLQETSTEPYKAFKSALEELDKFIEQYTYTKYWLAH